MQTPKTKRRWHVLWLIALSLLMALPGLFSIPAIDRDEARYAQASVQMAESGDLMNIRFQDEARNKKPAGAYWAQTAMITLAGGAQEPGATLGWQRLPSALAFTLAVLLSYLAAIPMIGRRGAVIAGSLLSVCLIGVFEAHIAKTDALLLASTTGVFAALARLRAGRVRGSAWLFWGSLGLSIFIKGPVGLAVTGLAILTLLAWERQAAWLRPLAKPLPIGLFFALWLPWAIGMYVVTDGQFYADSLGSDFGGKLASAQENHSGPPGYYLLSFPISLWPSSLLLIPGAVFAWQAARGAKTTLPARGMRLCIAWAVPFWLVLEIVPTKLIHYPLPLFPALCIAMACAVLVIGELRTYPVARWVSGIVFIIATAALLTIIAGAQVGYGPDANTGPTLVLIAVAGMLALTAAIALFLARMRIALGAGLAASVGLSVPTYGYLMPSLEAARVSQTTVASIPGPLVSPHYTEPSLVYYAGRDGVRFVEEWDTLSDWAGETLLLDTKEHPNAEKTLRQLAQTAGVCLDSSPPVTGFKYSNFDAVALIGFTQVACEPANAEAAPGPG